MPAAIEKEPNRNVFKPPVTAARVKEQLAKVHQELRHPPSYLRAFEQQGPKFQHMVTREARALGLRDCGKNPCTAEHSYYEDSGEQGGHSGGR